MSTDVVRSECCEAVVHWLDCDECSQAGETCEVIVCAECGVDIDV